MILTCPECSTRYMAKDGSIGPNGRTVRCAKCKSTWFVSADDVDPDAMALEDNETVLIEEEIVVGNAPQPELEFDSVGAHIALRDKADAQKLSRRRRVIALIWAVPLLLLGVATVLAILFRQEIVNRTPITASLYQGLGMDVKTGGLDIATPTTETRLVEGEPVLFVTTKIRNLSKSPKAAPMVGFSLLNRSGETVADWYVETGNIRAGGVQTVETQFPNPPTDGIQLSYDFAEE